jgi:hypothetical protein
VNGKKTYLVALGALLYAVGGFLHGDLSAAQAIQTGFEALLAATVRHGVASKLAA